MDLSYILTWTVASASGMGLAAMLIRYRLRFPGWIAVHSANLIVVIVLAIYVPSYAGLVAFALWAPTVLAPAIGAGYASRLITMQRYSQAQRLVQVLAALHPFDGWRGQPDLVLAMSLIQKGEAKRARELLEKTKGQDTWLGRMATLHLFRMDLRWKEMKQWLEEHPKRNDENDVAVMSFYLRALGELEDREALCRAYATVAAKSGVSSQLPALQLFTAAFTGRVDLVEHLFAGTLAHFPDELKAFWKATGQQAAGDYEGARAALEALSERGSALVRAPAKMRLQSPIKAIGAEEVSEEVKETLAAMAREIKAGRQAAEAPPRRAVATLVFLLINTGVFLLEIPGGTMDSENLYDLGALMVAPWLRVEDEWWRVVTACFLHFGPVHLAMNLLGLAIFGRRLERAVGHLRFTMVYLLAGVGGNLVYVLAAALREGEPSLLVGASGSIMGVVGAITAVLLKRWRSDRTRVTLGQLWPLGLMLAAQTVFDIMTPKVAMLVHISGAVIGLVVGAALGEGQAASKVSAIEER